MWSYCDILNKLCGCIIVLWSNSHNTFPFNFCKVKDFFFFQDGEIHPVSVKVGEKVLLPEYGGTKIVLEDKVCFPIL